MGHDLPTHLADAGAVGAMAACTQSTVVPASQARKCGLGLVFATQAPKYLHNRTSPAA
jgi:hypothetical protein